MKVFLSWSGDRSKAVAEYLNTWLPKVVQSVKPFFSPESIQKGSPWLTELNDELAAHSVAIVCLTPENRIAPWLLFEAGALSNAPKTSVCTLLLGLQPTDVAGPLAQFQATRTTKQDVRNLLGTVNLRQEASLAEDVLDAAYEAFWPGLESKLAEIEKNVTPAPQTKRSPDELLSEILEGVRNLARRIPTSDTDVGWNFRNSSISDTAAFVPREVVDIAVAAALGQPIDPHLVSRAGEFLFRPELVQPRTPPSLPSAHSTLS